MQPRLDSRARCARACQLTLTLALAQEALVRRTVWKSTVAIAVIAVAMATSVAQGQTRQVTGKVTMRETGQPVPDATVGIVGVPVGARTNERGEYRLNAPA